MIPARASFGEAVWRRLALMDQRLLLSVRRLESRWMTRLMRSLTHLGTPGAGCCWGWRSTSREARGPATARCSAPRRAWRC